MTLIEVLVALAIVAVTLSAGIKAAGGLTLNAQRMSDLAAQVTMSASGLSRAIDRLVAQGSIERVSCDYDRRVVHARLTDQGRAELDAMLLAAGDLNREDEMMA